MYAHHLAYHQPMRAPDLMAYLYIIATCHGEYHFHPCMAYDVAFRMKASRFKLTSWGHIDPSLPTQTLAIPPSYPPPYLHARPPPPTLVPPPPFPLPSPPYPSQIPHSTPLHTSQPAPTGLAPGFSPSPALGRVPAPGACPGLPHRLPGLPDPTLRPQPTLSPGSPSGHSGLPQC